MSALSLRGHSSMFDRAGSGITASYGTQKSGFMPPRSYMHPHPRTLAGRPFSDLISSCFGSFWLVGCSLCSCSAFRHASCATPTYMIWAW